MKKWLTTKEAAEALGISVSTLKRRIASGVYQTKMEATGRGRGGLTKLVLIDDQRVKKVAEEPKIKGSTQRLKSEPLSNSLPNKDLNKNQRLKINHCEPQKNVQVIEIQEYKNNSHCTENSVANFDNQRFKVVSDCKTGINNTSKVQLTIKTTANLLNISTRSVHKQISSNKLQAVNVPKEGGGSRTLVFLSSLPLEAQEKYKMTLCQNGDQRFNQFTDIEKRIGLLTKWSRLKKYYVLVVCIKIIIIFLKKT